MKRNVLRLYVAIVMRQITPAVPSPVTGTSGTANLRICFLQNTANREIGVPGVRRIYFAHARYLFCTKNE